LDQIVAFVPPRQNGAATAADAAGIGALIAQGKAGDRRRIRHPDRGALRSDLSRRSKWSGTRSDAEDIAQDVCVKLATALKSFDGRSAFSTWLYRITLNAVRDCSDARPAGAPGRGAAAVSPTDQPADQEEATTIGNYGARASPAGKTA